MFGEKGEVSRYTTWEALETLDADRDGDAVSARIGHFYGEIKAEEARGRIR